MKTGMDELSRQGHKVAGSGTFRLPLALTGLPVGIVISAILSQAKPEVIFNTGRVGMAGVAGLISEFIHYLTSSI